ncbi:MAG: alpha/beta hydrolase [Alphaproteobacteria bacterium]|nr:alpha/beta hydrolase [Alphaproteobacteria bacterium]MBU1516638.1 alpha/beta hydrolase [Alphaproteobacteria bacterium]MBU2094394.1 alpha/beta hydrolase [Alphaproteobacteria bacterium]MBU2153279.1 alpha/beta hydrolase [Alphaproteobacteria bacterium]MBU2307565.1 alpha/beta hydrolase [Alphaproteobacteria bacterium]
MNATVLLVLTSLALSPPTLAAAAGAKPTIVLVHGAFADGSSWNGVASRLARDGYRVIAAANPLRSVKSDADDVGALVSSIPGPVVLVGHSYAGAVISAAAVDRPNVKALVYVAAFEPASGETSLGLSAKFPGSTLGGALSPPVALPDGGVDLYIQQDKFPHQFAADLPAAQAAAMAASQRPITSAALQESQVGAAWQTIPSWSIWGDADLNIPPAAMAYMADRAKAKRAVVVKGASHVVMVSHPAEVADLIEAAAQ